MNSELFFFTVVTPEGVELLGNAFPISNISMIRRTTEGLHVFLTTVSDERVPSDPQYKVINGQKQIVGFKGFTVISAPLVCTLTKEDEIQLLMNTLGGPKIEFPKEEIAEVATA